MFFSDAKWPDGANWAISTASGKRFVQADSFDHALLLLYRQSRCSYGLLVYGLERGKRDPEDVEIAALPIIARDIWKDPEAARLADGLWRKHTGKPFFEAAT